MLPHNSKASDPHALLRGLKNLGKLLIKNRKLLIFTPKKMTKGFSNPVAQNSLRNTMIQLMFLVVESGHPDVQKGIKTKLM